MVCVVLLSLLVRHQLAQTLESGDRQKVNALPVALSHDFEFPQNQDMHLLTLPIGENLKQARGRRQSEQNSGGKECFPLVLGDGIRIMFWRCRANGPGQQHQASTSTFLARSSSR